MHSWYTIVRSLLNTTEISYLGELIPKVLVPVGGIATKWMRPRHLLLPAVCMVLASAMVFGDVLFVVLLCTAIPW